MRHTVFLDTAKTNFKKPVCLFYSVSAIGCDVFRTASAMDGMLGILWVLTLSPPYNIILSFDI
jgi:hypothetical protein